MTEKVIPDHVNPDRIRVEVVWAGPEKQVLRQVELRTGATAADAIRQSGLIEEAGIGNADFNTGAADGAPLDVGIWSKPVSLATELHDGDRVEIYRALKIDPKTARRERAGKSSQRNQP